MGGTRQPADSRLPMTFLFTDIEGSTRMWEQHPSAMPEISRRHDELIDETVAMNGGTVFHRAGDGVIASFDEVAAAVRAAVAIQRELAAADWSAVGELRVRIGVHHGAVVLRDGEPYGWALNFGARFSALGQGGQILVSEPAVEALGLAGDEPFVVRRLGTVRLRDIAQPAVVFQLVAPGLESEFSSLRDTSEPLPLPTVPNSLIGRSDEIQQLGERLATDRLVTVVGPPGVGKSRLVVETANALLGSFANGARLCSLAVVDDDRAFDAIVTNLGVSTRPGRTVEQSLIEWLGGQDLLIVLDDCERAHARVGAIVRAILESTPSVTVLCTSHRPLGVDGESIFRLTPLTLDAAVDLFIDRASSSKRSIAESSGLRELCEQLDRLPFSIEVAAAHAALHSIDELSGMLGPRDRPEVTGPNAALQSLVDALALSFEALPVDLRSMLVATTAFAGSFDRVGFRDVCAPGLSDAQAAAALTDLVNRSLVQAEPGDGRTQFRLLHGVWEFVVERGEPDELNAARRRFIHWVLDLVDDVAAGLRGPDEVVWNRRIGRQFDNIRAAFDRSLEAGDLNAASAICTRLWDYAFMRLNIEYFRWAERMIEVHGDRAEVTLGPVYGVAALGAWFRDDVDSAVEWAERALHEERTHDLGFDLPARLALINAAVYSGATAPPAEIYSETVMYERSLGDLYFQVDIEVKNSIMAAWLDHPEAALRRGIRAVRLARESGNSSSLAFALWALGSALETDDPFQAEAHLGNALSIARGCGNLWIAALVQMSLASLRRRTSGAIDAAPILLDLLEVLSLASHQSHLWHSLKLCALALGDLGDDALCVQLTAWVHDAELAMPALPVDEEAARLQMERIRSEHGDRWVERTEMLTATWTRDTAAAVARDALQNHLATVGSA